MSERSTTARSFLIPIVTVLIAGLLIAAIFWQQRASDSSGASSAGEEETNSASITPVGPNDEAKQSGVGDIAQRDPADPLATGPVDAPVAMVMFTDYQCPFCAQWTKDTLPAMRELAEQGKLRLEIKDVNIYGENSERAARASYAAGLQDNFWQFHAQLFAGGQIRDSHDLSREAMIETASELGLDIDRFTEDMDADTTADAIKKNEELGTDLGAFSTPAFIVNGKPILGAMPTDVFEDAVQNALTKAE